MLINKNIPSSKKIFSSVKRDGYILCENIISKSEPKIEFNLSKIDVIEVQ